MKKLTVVFGGMLLAAAMAVAQQAPTVMEGKVALTGGVPPAVLSANDLGRVDSAMRFDHLHLLLTRPAERTAALEQSLKDLQDPKSPNFHKWLTAAEFGSQYGATEEQEQRVTEWLTSNGLQVEGIDPSRMIIEFSGTAEQVESTLGTEIHVLQVGQQQHISNVTQLHVSAEVADAVTGVSLADFMPHPLYVNAGTVQRQSNGSYKQISLASGANPNLTTTFDGGNYQLVTPGDFATIYNLNPAWQAGYRGAGQTVVVLEDTLMNGPDVAAFRQAFGLSQYAGTFSQVVPAGSHPCSNPTITGDTTEASLDAQWAGATAPDANIVLAACGDTRTQFGGLTALQNLLVAESVPKVVSLSYGLCESEMGSTMLTEFYSTFQQAAAEGVSVFVSSGDAGAAVCDVNASYATHGNATSGFATTPYNTAVGGTDFYDTLQGTVNDYWSTTNSNTYESALSYVPEMPWNSSCADSALLAYEGAAVAYGPSGYCNNFPGLLYTTTASGSGGASSIYSKPTWQNTFGVPNDGARDIPDVSLFAANGFYGHALVFCDTLPPYGGNPCEFSNGQDAVYNSAGGTSFAAPAMAGIFALVNQEYGTQGNINAALYGLANLEYGTQGAPITDQIAACNSTNGKNVSSTCSFNDITVGDIDVPCAGSQNCYGSSASGGLFGGAVYGAESSSTATFLSSYPATQGWDYATGLGTVNVARLLQNWAQVVPQASTPPKPVLPIRVGPISPFPIKPVSPIHIDAGVN